MAKHIIFYTAHTRDGVLLAKGESTSDEPLTEADIDVIMNDFKQNLVEKTGLEPTAILVAASYGPDSVISAKPQLNGRCP